MPSEIHKIHNSWVCLGDLLGGWMRHGTKMWRMHIKMLLLSSFLIFSSFNGENRLLVHKKLKF